MSVFNVARCNSYFPRKLTFDLLILNFCTNATLIPMTIVDRYYWFIRFIWKRNIYMHIFVVGERVQHCCCNSYFSRKVNISNFDLLIINFCTNATLISMILDRYYWLIRFICGKEIYMYAHFCRWWACSTLLVAIRIFHEN